MYASSQNDVNNSSLAYEYYRTKEFDKAAVLYEKLYQSTNAPSYFSQYLRCLIELEDYKTAEKVIKKEIKRNPDKLSFYVELGQLYRTLGQIEESEKQFDLAIKNMTSDRKQIFDLANAFMRVQKYDLTEKVYLQGRKLLKGDYDFNMELAGVYQSMRKYDEMIREYIDLLETQPAYIQSVQNRLQNAVYSDLENDLNETLKNELLDRIQKNPGKTILSELLIWIYLQDKDFENAYIQACALDKRNKEHGDRLIELGRLSMSNKDYSVAAKSFKYVIDQGEISPYYYEARSEYLGALYQKIINSAYKEPDLLNIEALFIETLAEMYQVKEKAILSKDLSHLQAFYLDKKDEAIERLKKLIDAGTVDRKLVSELKLELADILLLSGDIWEATLYYGQVEKSNENSPIGYEAKFRKAKLAYYAGDFQWAQAQLDVLKASTSKLIANNAFELSQLISDNTALDTSEVAMQKFAQADLLLFQNKDSLAMLTYDSILNLFSDHSLTDEIWFRKARVASKKGEYEKSAQYLRQIIEKYPNEILGDDALFFLASITENIFKDKQAASNLYKEILMKYPGSIYVVDSRNKYRALRGDNLSKEEMFFYDYRDINP